MQPIAINYLINLYFWLIIDELTFELIATDSINMAFWEVLDHGYYQGSRRILHFNKDLCAPGIRK